MASQSSKNADCGKCGVAVASKDKAVECEVCRDWFHNKCEEVSDETYKVLQKDKKVHWYCSSCGKAAKKIYEILLDIESRQAKVENELKTMNTKLKEVVDKMEKISKECDKIKRMKEELEEQFEMNEQTVEAVKELKEKVEKALENDTQIKEVVKESMKEQFSEVTSRMSTVNNTLEQVRTQAAEQRDRESRACNVIIYNVTESQSNVKEERWKFDRKWCLDLFNKTLGVPIREDDMKRFLRLGKVKSKEGEPSGAGSTGARPVLIQFRDRILKNMIMESLSKLKDADDEYKKIIFAHDMTQSERTECKRLVQEAKVKQSEDVSGEFLYRVRGTPGNLRIEKIRKRN